MKLIITGASGPFGSSTVEGLLGRGIAAQDLILVSRTPERVARFATLGAQVRRGDFDDPRSLATAFAGGERMLFISTNRVGQRMPQHTNAVNAAVSSDPGRAPLHRNGDRRADRLCDVTPGAVRGGPPDPTASK